ncbi:NAD-glutamate dehydrogenase [Rhizobium rhizosphaerae]|uniref:NAD-glutamate dehydrogenase n=1 Tax=Xaviernesmea rhizosphaerae TaxID=1672749 RepID=UPI0009501BF5|nr:NAD-glutamate dehydrogenase [Xaviernesmea rhizosphaerae]
MSTKQEWTIDTDSAGKARADLDPALLFAHASQDDLEAYDGAMRSETAAIAAAEIAAYLQDGQDGARIQVIHSDRIAPEGQPISVLAVTERNMPFLYDSVMGEVTGHYRDMLLAIHPIFDIDGQGRPQAFDPETSADPARRLSHIQLHLPRLGAEEAETLKAQVAKVLAQVHLAVGDWQAMIERLDDAISALKANAPAKRKADRKEALAFLKWLRDDNFTFLGMREYGYSGEGETAVLERGTGHGLGILSDPEVRVLRLGHDAVVTTPEILAFLQGPDFLIVTKANVKSVVHRRTYMDYIGIKRFDAEGRVIGELRIVGLFASSAYTLPAATIPLLRMKVEHVVEHFGFDPESHSGKMLLNTLESYPRDDLFQIDTDLLQSFCAQINELSDRPRVRVLVRADRFDRFVSVLVYVPREQYDSQVREEIGLYLKTVYDGRVSAFYPGFPAGGLARVHFIIGRSGGKTPSVPQRQLEEAIRDIVTRWTDRLERLTRQAQVKLEAGDAYQATFTPEEAFADLPAIRAVSPQDPIRIAFYQRSNKESHFLELKIFHAAVPVPLSKRVPLLENLGFSVISEQTHELAVTDGQGLRVVIVHDMELTHRDGMALDLAKAGQRLEEAFLAAWNGLVEDDAYNRLVLLAGLTAREVTILRAYARYLRQAGITYSQGYIAETLNKYAPLAADIARLFLARMNPQADPAAREEETATRLAALEEGLNAVPSLDEDQILRRHVNAVLATLRTNYFQEDAAGKPPAMLAMKLDPKLLDGLPEPRPFREIFVYGTEVEGVHLRFGKVARGGLRWSDRAQDYRTEVLGLVKAQQVKNAVIVPVGAKGGFYPKQLPAGGSRDAVFSAGTAAYKTYIRTLLSITDNIIDQTVVPPANTLRLDEDDPYFVVAADKGTATFSDTANGLAQEAGFWLDDAFASGGSAGYDHKKMGITARGAWETVKRHFREMDIDIQTTPFTVAGVGDMSGDVFGNGMLLSRQIRLVAAFDHRDIFIDPSPDTETAFVERERLFALPRSSWQDYDRSLLSPGGMIISRAEKSVHLTPEAAERLGLATHVATPAQIMTAILKSPVDLLWFGGIGTYIRAASESDAEVGDKANDAIRIVAEDVGAKVIGEGANLGVTQRGRIAYALKGGRCNSDAIDNSAGVNSSDVEVNIKIALAPAMKDGRLPREERNVLLASMTDEVAHLVLRNNYLQSLAISLVERQGAANRTPLSRLMSRFEAIGRLNRKVEALPTDAALSERYQSGKALTRPEIGVLLSYSKIVLFDDVLDSDLPDDPYFRETLLGYFPSTMHEGHEGDILAHPLKREIIATVVVNEVINRGGPAFVTALVDRTGVLPSDVVKAAILARDGFDLGALYARIDALDNRIGGALQNSLYDDVGRIFAVVTERALRTRIVAGPLGAAVARLSQALGELKAVLTDSISDEALAFARSRAEALTADGAPADLAEAIATLLPMTLLPDILQIADDTGVSLTRTAQSYFAVTERLKVGALLVAADRVVVTDPYEAMALSRAIGDLAQARRAITIAALTAHKDEEDPVAAWQEHARERVQRVIGELSTLTEKGEATLAKLTVAAGLLGDLVRLSA